MKKLIPLLCIFLLCINIQAQTKTYKGGIYTFFEGRYDLKYKIVIPNKDSVSFKEGKATIIKPEPIAKYNNINFKDNKGAEIEVRFLFNDAAGLTHKETFEKVFKPYQFVKNKKEIKLVTENKKLISGYVNNVKCTDKTIPKNFLYLIESTGSWEIIYIQKNGNKNFDFINAVRKYITFTERYTEPK
jgi:hypothetical protein